MPTSDPDPSGEPTRTGRPKALEPTRVLTRPRARTLAEMFYGEPAAGDSSAAAPIPTDPAHSRARRAVIAVAVAVPALVALGIVLLLTLDSGGTTDRATPSAPSAEREPPAARTSPTDADPDGPGTLREGDTGPAVTDLQKRLRRIPDVYDPGAPVTGSYDAPLTDAVARFQLWYGVRGDETGVYGDDTRLALESRTEGGPE
ncbi:peptidoglycan-binding protein [Streptomyces sp. NPDC091292]|uniref:peptidoglycan-binding protein n=1 Tax=Streptomyces sp. NPDC091292 TaxID=3365991 RepID=UPI0037FD2BDD